MPVYDGIPYNYRVTYPGEKPNYPTGELAPGDALAEIMEILTRVQAKKPADWDQPWENPPTYAKKAKAAPDSYKKPIAWLEPAPPPPAPVERPSPFDIYD